MATPSDDVAVAAAGGEEQPERLDEVEQEEEEQPQPAISEEEEAIRIQAAMRGHKARKEVETMRRTRDSVGQAPAEADEAATGDAAASEEEEQEADADATGSGAFGSDEEAAAIQIQAVMRGHKARKEVQLMRQSRDSIGQLPADGDDTGQDGGDGGDDAEAEPSGLSGTADEEAAAIRIQAAMRGRKARREVQAMRESRDSLGYTGEEPPTVDEPPPPAPVQATSTSHDTAPQQQQQQQYYQPNAAHGEPAAAPAHPADMDALAMPSPVRHGGSGGAAPYGGDGRSPTAGAAYPLTDARAIDVEIDFGPGQPTAVVQVLMDWSQMEPKAYLGGFRNKQTGAEYHHAVTQTPREPKYLNAEPKLEREAQTTTFKTRSQQTVREIATQMERPDCRVDTAYDTIKFARPYKTADEVEREKHLAVAVIQRYARGMKARRRAMELRRLKEEREAFIRRQEEKRQVEADEQRQREIERRMHPRTAEDFQILYNELQAWRLQETAKVKALRLGAEREAAALRQLLAKETKLLQTIDRLKITANQENKERRIARTLGAMSKPKAWDLKNGGTAQVHTPYTTRAKELMQLYDGLNLRDLTMEERLDVLVHAKWTVKEFDCALTREIVELIDREADLLSRGRSPAMLDGLRKRIASLFLAFVETPEFNPEAARFQILPADFQDYIYESVTAGTSRPDQVPVTIGM